ncbi:hypothetical protein ACJX0J_019455, partial [Zea mays]
NSVKFVFFEHYSSFLLRDFALDYTLFLDSSHMLLRKMIATSYELFSLDLHSLPLFFYLAPYQISDYLVPRYSPGEIPRFSC